MKYDIIDIMNNKHEVGTGMENIDQIRLLGPQPGAFIEPRPSATPESEHYKHAAEMLRIGIINEGLDVLHIALDTAEQHGDMEAVTNILNQISEKENERNERLNASAGGSLLPESPTPLNDTEGDTPAVPAPLITPRTRRPRSKATRLSSDSKPQPKRTRPSKKYMAAKGVGAAAIKKTSNKLNVAPEDTALLQPAWNIGHAARFGSDTLDPDNFKNVICLPTNIDEVNKLSVRAAARYRLPLNTMIIEKSLKATFNESVPLAHPTGRRIANLLLMSYMRPAYSLEEATTKYRYWGEAVGALSSIMRRELHRELLVLKQAGIVTYDEQKRAGIAVLPMFIKTI